MRYRDLVLTKTEQIGNALNTLQAAVSRGDEETYKVCVEKITELLADITMFVGREGDE